MSESTPPVHRRLKVGTILWSALSFPWKRRGAVLRAAAAPLLAFIVVTFYWDFADFGESNAAFWSLYFLDAVTNGWLAISVHRLVLLDDTTARDTFDAQGLRRLGVFVGALIGVWLFYEAQARLTGHVTRFFWSRDFELPAGNFDWILVAGSLVLILVTALWLFARVCLLFPAIAVDRGFAPVAAWRLSRGNSLRLVVIVGVFPAAIGGPAMLLYRDEASALELVLLAMLWAVLLIVEVAALSFSYRQLTAPAPPPTGPPG